MSGRKIDIDDYYERDLNVLGWIQAPEDYLLHRCKICNSLIDYVPREKVYRCASFNHETTIQSETLSVIAYLP